MRLSEKTFKPQVRGENVSGFTLGAEEALAHGDDVDQGSP
jgi:hypothetical protein